MILRLLKPGTCVSFQKRHKSNGLGNMKAPPSIVVQLVHLHGPLRGEIQEFTGETITIGRHRDSHVRFPPDLGCMIVMPLTAILAGMIVPLLSAARRGDKTLFVVSLGVSAVGVILLFRARLPLYREGRFFTIGSAALPEPQKRLYRAAWKVILVGAGMLAILNVMLRI